MTDGERLAVVETDVKYIIQMLEDHCEAPSCQVCKLNDDMVTVKQHLRIVKWAGTVVVGVILSVLSKNWVVALINVWR